LQIAQIQPTFFYLTWTTWFHIIVLTLTLLMFSYLMYCNETLLVVFGMLLTPVSNVTNQQKESNSDRSVSIINSTYWGYLDLSPQFETLSDLAQRIELLENAKEELMELKDDFTKYLSNAQLTKYLQLGFKPIANIDTKFKMLSYEPMYRTQEVESISEKGIFRNIIDDLFGIEENFLSKESVENPFCVSTKNFLVVFKIIESLSTAIIKILLPNVFLQGTRINVSKKSYT
jgi:hypothetical protein